jgi:hypothetical protein
VTFWFFGNPLPVARKFSIWKKKIGHRQSGSQLWSGVSSIIFFAALMAIAFLLLVALSTFQVESWVNGRSGYGLQGFLLRLLAILALLTVSALRFFSTMFAIGTSAERRGALAKRASQLNMISETATPKWVYPNVPRDSNITNSPGVNLKYRLPIIQLSALRFFGLTAVSLLLIGVATALFVTAASNYQLSIFRWGTWTMAIVFLLAACLASYLFLWEILTYSGLGPTCIEISDHPLFPGKTYEIFASQSGRLRLRKLELKLVCREQVTFQQGTDIRTEAKTVRELPILSQSQVNIQPDLPYEISGNFSVPLDAMHSFQSSHNLIAWMIVVHGEVDRWPKFERQFPVVVFPPHLKHTSNGTAG